MNSSTDEDARARPEGYVVWRMLDGKAGHEAQTLGLVNALKRKVKLSSHDIRVSSRWKSFASLLLKRFGLGKSLPTPDLLIGAGSQTHFALLAASRTYRGKTIVLMQPTLPNSCFDLCLIPKHDLKNYGENTVLTDGVLNPMHPAINASSKHGLFLIGGPSTHYSWNTNQILDQVETLVQESPEINWTLTTSRRTPTDCTQQFIELTNSNLTVIPVEETPNGWVAERLQECKRVWVSEDSVSMVYESLTAGAQTGILTVPPVKQSSRVQNSVRLLLEQEHVVRFEERSRLPEQGKKTILAEADRCADYIVEHFLHG